jgi:hypothetical protein
LLALAALLGAGSVWALVSQDTEPQTAPGSVAVPASQVDPAAVEPIKPPPSEEAKALADTPPAPPAQAQPTDSDAEREPELDSTPEPRDNADAAPARSKPPPAKKKVVKKSSASRPKPPSQPVEDASAAPTSRSLLPQDDPLGSRH